MNVSVILGVFVCVAGLVMNSLSTSVFLRQDWRKNTVTVTLLSLTVSDICVLAWSLLYYSSDPLVVIASSHGVDLRSIQVYFFTWPRSMFYDISSCFTVLVSLERCLCVVLPLKVNSLLTPRRVKMLLFLVWSLGVATYIPVFASQFLVWKQDPFANTTVLTVALTSYRLKVETAHNIFNTLFLQTACQITVVVNTAILTSGLNRSTKFQNDSSNMSTAREFTVSSTAVQDVGVPSPFQVNDEESAGHENKHPLPADVSQSYKDIRESRGVLNDKSKVRRKEKITGPSTKYKRTIKVVSGVSCLFIICNTPLLVAVYMKNLAPGFNFGQKHQNEFLLAINIVNLTTAVNAASNFFVYTIFNTKFRDDLFKICSCKLKAQPLRVRACS